MALIPQPMLDRMKRCFPLLPDPGPEVALQLYDHIKAQECRIVELEARISELEAQVIELKDNK